MKRVWLILLATLGCIAVAQAQRVVIGERVPELKADTWLGGVPPSAAPLTYFEFFYSPGKGALESVGHLEELSNKLGSKLHVIVLTREPEATVTRLLGEKVSPLLVVALGAERDFGNFGVSYIPFGVLVDARNRALWMGNTRTLTVETIEQSLP